MRGAEQHARIIPEDVLRAIAVMHIPIDDGDALRAVGALGMARGDGNIVEKTEAHGPVLLGMVAGWSHGDKGILGLAAHHGIHRAHRTAERAQHASREPGEAVVSASSATSPALGSAISSSAM